MRRRLLLALSNNSPFPLRLDVQYYYSYGGYLYTPTGQPETEGYERGPIFDFIRYYMNKYAYGEDTCQIKYGDFTLYDWFNDVEVYITTAYIDDGNIGIYGYDASDNKYTGTIYTDYGEIDFGDDIRDNIYSYCPGEIYMYKSN